MQEGMVKGSCRAKRWKGKGTFAHLTAVAVS